MKDSLVFFVIILFIACTILFADRHGNIKAASYYFPEDNWEYRNFMLSMSSKNNEDTPVISSGELDSQDGENIIIDIGKTKIEIPNKEFLITDLSEMQKEYIMHGGGSISRRYLFKLL